MQGAPNPHPHPTEVAAVGSNLGSRLYRTFASGARDWVDYPDHASAVAAATAIAAQHALRQTDRGVWHVQFGGHRPVERPLPRPETWAEQGFACPADWERHRPR